MLLPVVEVLPQVVTVVGLILFFRPPCFLREDTIVRGDISALAQATTEEKELVHRV